MNKTRADVHGSTSSVQSLLSYAYYEIDNLSKAEDRMHAWETSTNTAIHNVNKDILAAVTERKESEQAIVSSGAEVNPLFVSKLRISDDDAERVGEDAFEMAQSLTPHDKQQLASYIDPVFADAFTEQAAHPNNIYPEVFSAALIDVAVDGSPPPSMVEKVLTPIFRGLLKR